MNIPALLLKAVCLEVERDNEKELPFYERGIKVDHTLIEAALCSLNSSPTKTLPQNCRNDIIERTPDGLDRRIKEKLGSDLRTANIISDLLAGAGIVEVIQVKNPETGRSVKGTRLLEQWCWESEAEGAEGPGKKAAEDISDQIISWRRDLHRIPEKGFDLKLTSEYLKKQLENLGTPYKPCAGSDLVGFIEGDLPGPVIGLRADMDGVAIKEETGLPFASETGFAVADSNRAEVTVDFIGSFPATVNDDMACFLEQVPGAYFFLGSKHPEYGDEYPHHNSRFDIDEAVLWKGTAVLTRAAFDFGF